MLNFTKNIDTKTLLLNTTKLAKFTPNNASNNALQILKGNKIQVVTKETSLAEEYDERKNSYAQEKMILAWHFSLLLPYLQERLSELIEMPIDTLHRYHDNSMQLQGFYQLCQNLTTQLINHQKSIHQLENPQKQHWSTGFRLLQNNLSNDLQQIVMTAQNVITQIIKQRKIKLTHEEHGLQIHTAGNFLGIQRVIRTIPLKYPLGAIKVGEQRYEVRAHLQSYRLTWSTPTKFQFTGKLNVSVLDNEQPIHAALLIYPSWDKQPLVEMTLANLNAAHDFAHNKFLKQYTENPIGDIRFEPVALRANFERLCSHATSNTIAPYFITLVSIAKSHSIDQITIYAPYHYSSIMYAYGFYSLPTDELLPTQLQQQQAVNHAFAAGIQTPKDPKHFKRANTNNEPLLRPFCFRLNWLGSRPVILTEAKIKTTYAKLLSESTMNERKEGILPEVLQIPLKFTGNLFKLNTQREIAGKLKRPTLSYVVEKVDYEALNNDGKLPHYAFSDPEASEQSQYQKMLVLKRILR
ncbi:MAG TPA: hypothetical protein PLD88_07255 [Candidatus Berkiella sp.]|nr:hypothetical protein [Candidatus Berkiella sp.]